MDEPPDLQDVTAFLAVVDTGSFTAAADRLGLAKSNVSRRVARLEDQLGARLLERSTRRQRLTDVGESYHAQVTGAVAQLADAARSVAELMGEPKGRLRITAPSDWNEGVGQIVAEFCARYPKVQLEVELTQRRVDLIAEGFDVALRAGKLEDSSLIARAVGMSQAHLFASPQYLEQHGEPQTIAELADHDCILFRARHGQMEWTLEGPDGRSESVTVRGRISTQDFGFVRVALMHGAGIAFLPDSLGVEPVRQAQLKMILPDYKSMSSPFHLVYPSSRYVAPNVRAFVDFCVQWFERLAFAVPGPTVAQKS
ncbi:MAG: LysR family transcriptional regulator [Myxococcota bacterium]